jgi:branched-subunit amino acid aminotransferase/4-amino-4-deoxychorismate lyase
MPISNNGKFVTNITLKGNEPEFGRAYGVFETLRTYHGQPFMVLEHLQRLQRSAQQMHFKLPQTLETIRTWILVHCTTVPSTTEWRIKIIAGTQHIYIISEPLPILPKKYFTQGVAVQTYALTRCTPTIKNLGYWQEHLAHETAIAAGCYDALLINKHQQITEGAFSNFFWIKDNSIYTANHSILAGITRQIVLQLAHNYYSIQYRSLRITEISQIDECFLTQTSAGLLPITRIDQHLIAYGKPGLITKKLIALFEQFTRQEVET